MSNDRSIVSRILIRSITMLSLSAVVIGSFFVGGCNTDCIYESYTTDQGQDACARVCPLKDAEGNEVLDSNGKTVYESPLKGDDVDRINCDPFRSVTNSGSSTTTTTTSGTTTSG